MKRTIPNLLLSLLAPAILTAAASAASFPVPATDASGVTRWGYMADGGRTVTDFIYASAGEFAENGLAAVTSEDGKLAFVREDGRRVTGWLEMPESWQTEGPWLALNYGKYIDFYDAGGTLAASIEGASGFPGDGMVVSAVREKRQTLYGYRLLQPEPPAEPEPPSEGEEKAEASGDGKPAEETGAESPDGAQPEQPPQEANPFAIEPQYLAAGNFRKGRALVRTCQGVYAVINTRGEVLRELPGGTVPIALDIYADDVVILEMQGRYALYSLENMQFLTSFSYDEILPFDRSAARCRSGNLWGLVAADGSVILEPTYPYLSYMGEGVYAARGTDPGAAAISENGTVLYSTGTYVGGFQTFTHGYSWHGRLDGSVVFFNSIGTIAQPFTDAVDPQVMTGKVVRITRDGVDCYLDIRSGETIYTNDRQYTLGDGLEITAETYEKYLGMRSDGTEYGYHVEYPQLSGHPDEAVQAAINDSIRNFFVSGPGGEQDRSLEATFGFSVEGQVLVVWANGISGLDNSAVLCNDSIGLDLVTGERYTAYGSLFGSDASATLSKRLPKGAPYFSYPRMDAGGVTFYRNYPSVSGSAPYAKPLRLTFSQLAGAVNTDSACYRALTAKS